MSDGFFKAIRSEVGIELALGYPKAFILLYFMACRARRHGGFNRHGLAVNECFLGDYTKMGLSEREYRTAKMILQKHGFATFRATNKGTIGTIANTMVWDINAEGIDGQDDTRATPERRTSDGRETTNEEVKKERSKEGGPAGPHEPSISDQAKVIYGEYPLKVARPAALRAITKALRKVPFSELLERTRAYARAVGKGSPFTPNPATWFNQERYNDDPETWVRKDPEKKQTPTRIESTLPTVVARGRILQNTRPEPNPESNPQIPNTNGPNPTPF